MSAPIKFGTDGWRAVIADDFTFDNVRRVAAATADVFAEADPGGLVLVGYDTRFRAGAFAAAAAEVMAARGLKVRLSDRMLPTPALSWATDRSDAVGAVMLTASHNPAEYLGFKIKTSDGGSAPPSITSKVEAAIPDEVPRGAGDYEVADIVTPYLAGLADFVDGDLIRAAAHRVAVDPLYGAGQGYLAQVLRQLGAQVEEIHSEPNPGFGGLHPEPIPPHIDEASVFVREKGLDAGFCTDGDADRIGAIDESGAFVNPHRIFSLVILHLVEDRGMTGAVVKTLSTSVLVDRVCRHLGLELRVTPIGFKHIYEHMVEGGVLIGGEESGGIGIPEHVRERDGLAMALLLAEMMAQRGRTLGQLVEDLFEITGRREYRRLDLSLPQQTKDAFVAGIPATEVEQIAGMAVEGVVREDGLKLLLPDDAWLLMRPSGTEPLIRVYAEAETMEQVESLLEAGREFVLSAGER
ncbi:MAG: phosphoglucomutase/phosphomannomutase family protein [Coriobacteriia bacterium]